MHTILVIALLALAGPPVQNRPAAAVSPIFRFDTGGFWLNLHHFLYVLGRAEAKTSDAARVAVAGAPGDAARGRQQMSAAEQGRWAAAVTAYANGLSLKDAVFDAPLPSLTGALARAGDASSLSGAGVDPAAAATLESVADLYRRLWWPAHRAANEAWVASMRPLLAEHGPAVLAYVTRAYALPWPGDGYPVQVSAWANWAGAYSTDGNLLVLSSLDAGLAGLLGLETLFHEAMHQWDEPVFRALLEQARGLGIRISTGITHAMIFFTAGEAVRSVSPSHVPYADAAGVWGRGMARFKPALEEFWKPWLDGRGTRDQALAALAPRAAIPR
ncbi:MAG: hypothetical protein M3Q55_07475 [Acidobacteriota bacterium]|nr:hypothetical protein [Acidobacteriota bacterium]